MKKLLAICLAVLLLCTAMPFAFASASTEPTIVAPHLEAKAGDTIEVAIGATDPYQSKAELGNNYGMSAIGKSEWYVQAQAFESYVVGKTAAEVAGITTDTVIAGCTIYAGDFVSAVSAACNDKYKVAFSTKGDITLGVSTVAASDAESGEITVDFGAVAMVDGKAVAATLDCAAATIANGTFTFDGTKRALGNDYGMSAIGKTEWYVQAQNFANEAVGKNATEIAGITSAAGCTIYAGSMQKVLGKAASAVR